MKNIKSFGAQAFTLIELLIVVTIISILVGIGVPALRDSQAKAATAKVNAVKSQVATAKTRYVLDNSAAAFDALSGEAAQFAAIQPYIQVNGVTVVDENALLTGCGTAALTIGNSQTAPSVSATGLY